MLCTNDLQHPLRALLVGPGLRRLRLLELRAYSLEQASLSLGMVDHPLHCGWWQAPLLGDLDSLCSLVEAVVQANPRFDSSHSKERRAA